MFFFWRTTQTRLLRWSPGSETSNNLVLSTLNTDSLPEPRLDPPSFADSLCWGLLTRCSRVPPPPWCIWDEGVLAEGLICLAAKSRSGMAFISSAWVSSSSLLMSWALYCVRLARFSSQSRSAACECGGGDGSMNQTRPQKTTDDEAAKNVASDSKVQSSYQSDLHG